MAMAAFTVPSTSTSLLRPHKISKPSAPIFRFSPLQQFSRPFRHLPPISAKKNDSSSDPGKKTQQKKREVEMEEIEEVEEDLPWIQEKALDLVEFTGSVTQALPGPRVGQSSLPWILAVPLAYLGVTFVIAVVKTVKKFSSPREKRRKLVNKNAVLCKSIDELLPKGIEQSDIKGLMQKLRKSTTLSDNQVAEILNDVSRRIVQDKGPVVMDMTGYSEKGFKRKLAVQALFGKLYYLSELPEFCSRDSSLIVKEIFGVTDDDADKLRVVTLSKAGDVESLQKMVDNDKSNTEDSSESTPREP